MQIISIIGEKNSGKTSLSVKIIKELKNRGFKVASIKYSGCKLEMDRENTDTWQHKLAGSQTVVGIGASSYFNIQKIIPLERLLFLIKIIDTPDFVVLEGFKNNDYAKIATSQSKKDEYTIELVDSFKITDKELEKLVDKIEKESYDIIDTLFTKNPDFKSGEEIANGIIENKISLDDISTPNITLSINDKLIPLNEFTSQFLKESILGMLNSLKASPNKDKIEILINNSKD
jgi:molybdopterin-guanine dinucleotide biosynthesis protein B